MSTTDDDTAPDLQHRALVTLREAEELIGMSPEFILLNLHRWVKEGRMLDVKLRRGDLIKIRETYRADREQWKLEALAADEDDGA